MVLLQLFRNAETPKREVNDTKLKIEAEQHRKQKTRSHSTTWARSEELQSIVASSADQQSMMLETWIEEQLKSFLWIQDGFVFHMLYSKYIFFFPFFFFFLRKKKKLVLSCCLLYDNWWYIVKFSVTQTFTLFLWVKQIDQLFLEFINCHFKSLVCIITKLKKCIYILKAKFKGGY